MIEGRTVSVERIIAAPADAVFAVLDDLERYPEWNPFTERVITTKRVGDPVEIHVDMPGRSKMVMHETMTLYEAPHRMAWGLKVLGGVVLDCDRVQEVVALPDGRTRYRCWERFGGLLGPLVVLTYGRSTERGFEACADALVSRMEKP